MPMLPVTRHSCRAIRTGISRLESIFLATPAATDESVTSSINSTNSSPPSRAMQSDFLAL